MLAQRGADLTRENSRPQQSRKLSREAASVVPGARPAKRRLTFTDRHALETLPKTIAKLQTEIDALQAKLADPQFYARDRTAFEKVTAALGALQLKIAAAEEQWLELEILREGLANN
jgi:ATP-binding cassette subfamily F protein uup